MFAGAGILWGAVTVFRGMQTWKHTFPKNSNSFVIALGTAVCVSCIGYLVHRI